MNKILLLLLCGMPLASCIDKECNFDNLEVKNITIGDNNSAHKIPLASISLTLNDLAKTGVNITELLKEAKIWLPTVIPGGVDYIEINRLEEQTYINSLLDALIAEMSATKTDKLNQITDHIWLNYQDDFIDLLKLPSGATITEEQFKTAFKSEFPTNMEMHNRAKDLAQNYLTSISIDPLEYTIDQLDLGSEVIDMIANNLDPAEITNPTRTLHLYGQITSKLPLSVEVNSYFTPTEIKIASVTVEADAESPLPETRLFAEDIRTLANGSSTIHLPIELQHYYPKKEFDTTQKEQVILQLRLIKRGGLSLNL